VIGACLFKNKVTIISNTECPISNNERESSVFYIQNSLFEITDTAVLIEMFILWRVPPAGRSGGARLSIYTPAMH